MRSIEETAIMIICQSSPTTHAANLRVPFPEERTDRCAYHGARAY